MAMHPVTHKRLLEKLESGYCLGRKATIASVGAFDDYFTLEYIVSGSKMMRSESRKDLAEAINQWAGFGEGGAR